MSFTPLKMDLTSLADGQTVALVLGAILLVLLLGVLIIWIDKRNWDDE